MDDYTNACPTRNERTIDLAYSNVAEAYKCTPLPPLGDSDHNIISLMPKYRPILKTRKPISQQRRVLAPGSMERLQGCLECTDWTVFIDACDDFDELTDTINSYIKFCEENVTTVKEINRFPNEKSWVTKELRELLKKKRQAQKKISKK